MNSPRYLMRLAIVKQLLQTMSVDRFLEIGYGQGEMLVEMAKKGCHGDGYDESNSATSAARHLLKQKSCHSIHILDSIPSDISLEQRYSHILFFELIGYVDDPENWLRGLQALLVAQGCLIFSFTNHKHCGPAEQANGGMRCFTKSQMKGILTKAGYDCEIINYGYPLTNMLRPLLHMAGRVKYLLSNKSNEKAIHESGQAASGWLVSRLYQYFSPVVVWPFLVIQEYFKDSNLGTGYVVIARRSSSAQPL